MLPMQYLDTLLAAIARVTNMHGRNASFIILFQDLILSSRIPAQPGAILRHIHVQYRGLGYDSCARERRKEPMEYFLVS